MSMIERNPRGSINVKVYHDSSSGIRKKPLLAGCKAQIEVKRTDSTEFVSQW